MHSITWSFREGHPERYRYLDDWPPGPWDDEPDKVQWVDQKTGLPCLALRNPLGAWCGYVGLPAGHPWREMDTYWDIPAMVHGGLTYGPAPCASDENGICHLVESPEEDDVEWIGFDCNHHSMDLSPGMMATDRLLGFPSPIPPLVPYARYRDIHYVLLEVCSLARQAAEAKR